MSIVRFIDENGDAITELESTFIPSLNDTISIFNDDGETELYRVIEVSHYYRWEYHRCVIVVSKLREDEI